MLISQMIDEADSGHLRSWQREILKKNLQQAKREKATKSNPINNDLQRKNKYLRNKPFVG